jgi:hypothetical protein
MNGATALPSLKIIKRLMSNMTKMIGPSHHFFRVFMKPQNSARIENLLLLRWFMEKV